MKGGLTTELLNRVVVLTLMAQSHRQPAGDITIQSITRGTLRCGIAPSYPTLVVKKSRIDLILIGNAQPGNGAGLATNYLYFNGSSTVAAGGAGT